MNPSAFQAAIALRYIIIFAHSYNVSLVTRFTLRFADVNSVRVTLPDAIKRPVADLVPATKVRKFVPQKSITITTRGQGLYEFTDEAAAFVRSFSDEQGLLTLFVRHTSCSLLIQENADPDVQRDLKTFFSRLVPPSSDPSMAWVIHTMEGPDDMPAHIKSALTQVSLGIPVSGGKMVLGTWQGIYLFEHRNQPHERQIIMHLSV